MAYGWRPRRGTTEWAAREIERLTDVQSRQRRPAAQRRLAENAAPFQLREYPAGSIDWAAQQLRLIDQRRARDVLNRRSQRSVERADGAGTAGPEPGEQLAQAAGTERSPFDVAPQGPDLSRSVYAVADGVVEDMDWQDGDNRGVGFGYRIYVREASGAVRVYAHMDSDTPLSRGMVVAKGQWIGDYADPTNGHSTGPHVHTGLKIDDVWVDPGTESPVIGGEITSYYEEVGPSHPKPHSGVDWRRRR
jgi:murein DD-endopeptidase MepM/ murein hydrolase activator NlpD